MDAARVNTIRAHERPFHVTLKIRPDTLQVWLPGAFGLVVRVTDVVTDGSAFATNRAYSGHF
jgi:hypothetical protein